MSVGDLIVNKAYYIDKFSARDTKYGPAISSTLNDKRDGVIEIFQPKSVLLIERQINVFNSNISMDVSLISREK